MNCVRVEKDEIKEGSHPVRPGVDQQMQPVRSEFFQCCALHILVAMHYLLSEVWKQHLGEQTILWKSLRCLRLVKREVRINQSIAGIN
jgi:hypothetical protein